MTRPSGSPWHPAGAATDGVGAPGTTRGRQASGTRQTVAGGEAGEGRGTRGRQARDTSPPRQYGEPKASRSSPCPTAPSPPCSIATRGSPLPHPSPPLQLRTARATGRREPGRRRPLLARVLADRRSETRERQLGPRARRSALQNAGRVKPRGVRPHTVPGGCTTRSPVRLAWSLATPQVAGGVRACEAWGGGVSAAERPPPREGRCRGCRGTPYMRRVRDPPPP